MEIWSLTNPLLPGLALYAIMIFSNGLLSFEPRCFFHMGTNAAGLPSIITKYYYSFLVVESSSPCKEIEILKFDILKPDIHSTFGLIIYFHI